MWSELISGTRIAKAITHTFAFLQLDLERLDYWTIGDLLYKNWHKNKTQKRIFVCEIFEYQLLNTALFFPREITGCKQVCNVGFCNMLQRIFVCHFIFVLKICICTVDLYLYWRICIVDLYLYLQCGLM